MAPKSDFRKYMDATGELPDDALLGQVVLFTITDQPIKREDMSKWFDENGLNSKLLPFPNKAVDAYKKATSEINGMTYEIGPNTATLLCRDVSSSKDYIIRQITREIRDPQRRSLSYGRAIDVMFVRPTLNTRGRVIPGTEQMKITIDNDEIGRSERSEIKTVADRIEELYDRYANYMDGPKVRMMVRDYIKYLNALELKPSVYFVHQSRAEELLRLRTLVEGLGGGCWMRLIPLVDLESEREMVVEAFQREASQQLTELVTECGRLKEGRQRITGEAYAKLKERYDTVMVHAQEHLNKLKITQDTTGSAAEIALDALIDLQRTMLNQGSQGAAT